MFESGYNTHSCSKFGLLKETKNQLSVILLHLKYVQSFSNNNQQQSHFFKAMK